NPDFDCVVLDYKMPVMDGFEAAKSILNVNPKQRIIFASAYLDETIEKQIQKLKRITEIIKKPFKINDMVTVLESTEMHTMVEKFNMNISKKDGNITHDEMIDIMSDIKNITEEN
ncbi:response regulator, partial [Nitrosopumilus sp. Nsub]|uniref:response regulator n=1 Tax=Nitrosopumilus sp. Nsub TaxID=1776294 RepID=UPI000AA77EA7